MVLKRIRIQPWLGRLLILSAVCALSGGLQAQQATAPTPAVPAKADEQPLALIMASKGPAMVTNLKRERYPALPLQRLFKGHQIDLNAGARVAIALPGAGQQRVYTGPARLWVGAGAISVRPGPAPKVKALSDDQLDLLQQWLTEYPRRGNKADLKPTGNLEVLEPRQEALLLSRSPEFQFRGELPREGSLLLFDGQGKRFWVQQLDKDWIHFPSSVGFDWGQNFTWEVRKATGGRVLSGSFRIASEHTARTLLAARVPQNEDSPLEDLAFYAMRLQLARAYDEADSIWTYLGIAVDRNGRPARIPPEQLSRLSKAQG